MDFDKINYDIKKTLLKDSQNGKYQQFLVNICYLCESVLIVC